LILFNSVSRGKLQVIYIISKKIKGNHNHKRKIRWCNEKEKRQKNEIGKIRGRKITKIIFIHTHKK
jgi:hypothetical protein